MFSNIFFAGINNIKNIIKHMIVKNPGTSIPADSIISTGENAINIQINIVHDHQKYLITVFNISYLAGEKYHGSWIPGP